MIYLFNSASTPLYKRDALECLCYPPGHLFRFRYRHRHVDPNILNCPQNSRKKEGVIVFLDSVGQVGEQKFEFLPIRKMRTVRLFREAEALYIDFKFGEFINYGPQGDQSRQAAWHDFFLKLQNRPWPPQQRSGRAADDPEGYFILWNKTGDPEFPTDSAVSNEAWESLIFRADNTLALKNSTFFQILGLYEIKRRPPWVGRLQEVLLKPRDNSYESIYPVPMGKSVGLKLLFSRPSFDPNDKSQRRELTLTFSREAFAGVSKEIVSSESRYNQERIVLVCRRVFDSFLSPISIKLKDASTELTTPSPFILTRIRVPRFTIGVVIAGVVLTTFLIGLDSDSIVFLGTLVFPGQSDFLEKNATMLSTVSKTISPLPIALSTYLAFRKLPLK